METAESRNARTERLLEEGVRTDRHPLIYFRQGASGRRRPALAGTRLDVSHVIETVRGEAGTVTAAAEYLSLPPRLVQACVDYYAEFPDEVDAQRAEDQSFADAQRQRWEPDRARSREAVRAAAARATLRQPGRRGRVEARTFAFSDCSSPTPACPVAEGDRPLPHRPHDVHGRPARRRGRGRSSSLATPSRRSHPSRSRAAAPRRTPSSRRCCTSTLQDRQLDRDRVAQGAGWVRPQPCWTRFAALSCSTG